VGFKVNMNASILEASILNIAQRAARDASATMRKTAIRIRDLARSYAPYKTGALEKAIDYTTIKGANNRNVFVVFVDLDKMNPGPAGHQVGDYAMIMENELRPYNTGARGHLNLGDGSNIKTMMGNKVGARFLSRAVKEGSQQIMGDALAAVVRSLGGSSSVNVAFQPD
jgi:hypothetical protein